MCRSMIKAVCGLLLLAGLFQTQARAGEELPTPYVVIVGIDDYADKQIKDRKHAEADAKALYDLFISKDHLGVTEKNIKLLLGKEDPKRHSEPATKKNIIDAVTWLEKSAGKNDLVVFAFIGQGAPVGERACYFAVDSTFKDRAKNAVASGEIEHHLDKLKSQKFLALIDVNFMGFDAGKEPTPDANLANFYREYMGSEEVKGHSLSRVILLPNSGLKPSLDLDKHGVFSQVVLDALGGKADVDGYEADGNITVSELIKYFRKELPNLARAHGKNDEQKNQFPGVLDYQSSDFIIDLNPKAFPKAHERLTKFDKIAKERMLPKKLTEEGHNLLSRMPKLENQQALRKTYQKLVDGQLEFAAFEKQREEILESAKLSERDASHYAVMVMSAVRIVRQGYVKDVNNGELIAHAINGLYDEINEKLPSDIKEKLKEAKELKDSDLIKALAAARQHLGKREDLASGKDITYSLHAMLAKLDRHTDYIDPETLTRLTQDIQGHFSGIGVQIRKNNVKDMLQVVTPIINSPAYKAKIRANDIITTIIRDVDGNGDPLPKPETISTKGMSTEDAVKKILGKEGTKVKLLIEREGEKSPLEFELIRGKVEMESVMGIKRKGDDSWDYVVDPANKICYVRLSQFSHNTARDLEAVMRKLAKEGGIKGFILDLRFNPGGLLDSAVKISDLFIEDGLIVTIRPRNGPETSYVGKSDGSYSTFPMVCLVNGGSASASEIVSACLQDHHRAIIMGSRSYGKGSVQTIHPFATGGRLKLTTATFWRPSGKNLNRASTKGRDEDEWGVTPDAGFLLKIGTKELNDLQDHQRNQEIIRGPTPTAQDKVESKTEFQDRQLEMAIEYLRHQLKTAAKVNGKKAG